MNLELYCVQLHGTHGLWEVFSCCDGLSLNYNLSAPVRMVLILVKFHMLMTVLKQRYWTKKSYTWKEIFDKLRDWSREQGKGREHRGEGDRRKRKKIKLSAGWIQNSRAGEGSRRWQLLCLNKHPFPITLAQEVPVVQQMRVNIIERLEVVASTPKFIFSIIEWLYISTS